MCWALEILSGNGHFGNSAVGFVDDHFIYMEKRAAMETFDWTHNRMPRMKANCSSSEYKMRLAWLVYAQWHRAPHRNLFNILPIVAKTLLHQHSHRINRCGFFAQLFETDNSTQTFSHTENGLYGGTIFITTLTRLSTEHLVWAANEQSKESTQFSCGFVMSALFMSSFFLRSIEACLSRRVNAAANVVTFDVAQQALPLLITFLRPRPYQILMYIATVWLEKNLKARWVEIWMRWWWRMNSVNSI